MSTQSKIQIYQLLLPSKWFQHTDNSFHNFLQRILQHLTRHYQCQLGVGRAQARLGSTRLVTKEGSSSSSARLEGGSARSSSARIWLDVTGLEARLGSIFVGSKARRARSSQAWSGLKQALPSFKQAWTKLRISLKQNLAYIGNFWTFSYWLLSWHLR